MGFNTKISFWRIGGTPFCWETCKYACIFRIIFGVSQDCLKRYLYRHKEDIIQWKAHPTGNLKVPQKHLKMSSDLIVPCFFEPLRRALSSENSVAQSGWAERCESALRSALESFLEAMVVGFWLMGATGGWLVVSNKCCVSTCFNHTWQGWLVEMTFAYIFGMG